MLYFHLFLKMKFDRLCVDFYSMKKPNAKQRELFFVLIYPLTTLFWNFCFNQPSWFWILKYWHLIAEDEIDSKCNLQQLALCSYYQSMHIIVSDNLLLLTSYYHLHEAEFLPYHFLCSLSIFLRKTKINTNVWEPIRLLIVLMDRIQAFSQLDQDNSDESYYRTFQYDSISFYYWEVVAHNYSTIWIAVLVLMNLVFQSMLKPSLSDW